MGRLQAVHLQSAAANFLPELEGQAEHVNKLILPPSLNIYYFKFYYTNFDYLSY
jgi:hypothetical protein